MIELMNAKNAILVGVILTVSALSGAAQNAQNQTTNPLGSPSPAWRLNPEQRAEHRQKTQILLNDLRVKRDNGTITMNEKAWLESMEQTGGTSVNGAPRGGGRGGGFGPRNGTGPRAQMGFCPLAANNQAAAVATGPGPGFGQCWCGGRGPGFGRGFGLRNGTGPRAQMGLCPLAANNQAATVTPSSGNDRSPGFGRGWGGGRGRGAGGGFGRRDGTGPRAQIGACPLTNNTAPSN
jgi:hypothetical protein